MGVFVCCRQPVEAQTGPSSFSPPPKRRRKSFSFVIEDRRKMYPRHVSCSLCTTKLVIEDASLEAFVACPSCGAQCCEKCERWLDPGELLVHRCPDKTEEKDSTEGGAISCSAEEPALAVGVVEDDCWSFWERVAPADEEIEVEWEWDKGDVRWEAATVTRRESSRGVRVEYLEDETGDGKEFVHGLKLSELSVDERLDVLAECGDDSEAEKVPWLRCESSAEILTDLVCDHPRRWRPRFGEQDNGRVNFSDAAARAAGRWLRNSDRASCSSPTHKKRKDENDDLAVSIVATLSESPEAHYEAMLALLEHVELPRSERKNVLRRDCENRPRAVNVGVTTLHRGNRVALSQSLDMRDNLLAQALTAFFRTTSNLDRPFTSVQINRCDESSQISALHVDRNNQGPSLIVGFGDYDGGQLWTADKGVLSVKHKWTEFDGRLPHAALPFDGTLRYTLIFWCCARAEQLPRSHKLHAERLGFCFPTAMRRDDIAPPLPRTLSLNEARAQYKEACEKIPNVPKGWADD